MTNAFEMSLVNEHLHCLKAEDGFDKTSQKSHSTEKGVCYVRMSSLLGLFWQIDSRSKLIKCSPLPFSRSKYIKVNGGRVDILLMGQPFIYSGNGYLDRGC